MSTLNIPVSVVDEGGRPGTVIGSAGPGPIPNSAGVIETNDLILFGGGDVSSGKPRLNLLGEPGIIEVVGDTATIRLDTSGTISAEDVAGSRAALNSSAKLTLTDSTGNFSITLDPTVGIKINNASPGFSSSALFEFTGRVTLIDAFGNQTVLDPSDATSFGGNVGVGGNLTVNGDVFLPGADCAEFFHTSEAAKLEPGTVLVIDEAGSVAQSRNAYDRRVAGIVSGAGSHRPAIFLDRHVPESDRVPIALVGKVFCKVDADIAPIAIGDLLTTASTPGHAMRADDPQRAFGAVVGKALGAMARGRGLIPVLIALQ